MVTAAFIGWQFIVSQPRRKGSRVPNFKDYLRKMGIAAPALGTFDRGKQLARANLAEERVRKAFSRATRS